MFQIVLIFEETAVSLVIHNITHQSQYGSGIAICIFFRENENPHKLEKFNEFSMIGILLANAMNLLPFHILPDNFSTIWNMVKLCHFLHITDLYVPKFSNLELYKELSMYLSCFVAF